MLLVGQQTIPWLVRQGTALSMRPFSPFSRHVNSTSPLIAMGAAADEIAPEQLGLHKQR
jgi:hypothetical protein